MKEKEIGKSQKNEKKGSRKKLTNLYANSIFEREPCKC